MICPVCQQEKSSLSSAVVNGVYLSRRCDDCLAIPKAKAHSGAREFDRNQQRHNFRKDLIQGMVDGKPNADFLKAYPDKAHERFTEQEIRDLERGVETN